MRTQDIDINIVGSEWKYSTEFLGKQYNFVFPVGVDFNKYHDCSTLAKIIDTVLKEIEKDIKG